MCRAVSFIVNCLIVLLFQFVYCPIVFDVFLIRKELTFNHGNYNIIQKPKGNPVGLRDTNVKPKRTAVPEKFLRFTKYKENKERIRSRNFFANLLFQNITNS